MKIDLYGLILAMIGLALGIYKIFIDTTGDYLNKAIGILSFALSIMLLISCVSNMIKNKHHL